MPGDMTVDDITIQNREFFGNTQTDSPYLVRSSNTGVSLYSQANSVRSGLDVGPTRGTLPTIDALAEFVIYRTVDQQTNFARLNLFSALTPASTGPYRFGQEFGGTEVHHDIEFAEESGVTTGTEVYLAIEGRDGNSQRVALKNGHLRFDIAERGGAANSYSIGRGGGNTLAINVPSGAVLQLMVNNEIIASLSTSSVDFYRPMIQH